MRNLERATFIATILGLVLLVGVLYLKVSSDNVPVLPAAALLPSAVATGSAVPAATPNFAVPPIGPGPSSRLAGVIVSVRRESSFLWPASGPVTSYFGPGHPTGIDVGLNPDEESIIHASAAGSVSFAGGDACCDYGLNVVIDHGDGNSSLYGHLSELRVETGQQVAQGDVIGLGGATGNATGKHLHFELSLAGSPVDPLRYLAVDKVSVPEDGASIFACKPGSIPVGPASTVLVSFLPTLSVALGLESVSLDAPPAGSGAPVVELVKDGNLATLSIGPVGAAFGQTYAYNLKADLVQPNDLRQSVECNLELSTLETFPNVIDTGDDSGPDTLTPGPSPARGRGESEAPSSDDEAVVPPPVGAAAATPTSTAVPGRPSATAVATQGTAVPGATATSLAPRSAVFPTATSAAPKPLVVPTATPAAPRPAPPKPAAPQPAYRD